MADISGAQGASPGGKTGAFTVSVIITNYNYARFLRCAIESVLDQSLPGVECIVVDDGSTDGSQEIIESYPNVRSICQRNQGQAAALRAGAQIATGDIIISLDSDDFLYPQTCERVAATWSQGVSCLNYRLDVYEDETKTPTAYPTGRFLISGHLEYLQTYGYYPSAPMSGNAFAATYLRTLLQRAIHLDGDGVDAYLLYSAPVFGRMAHIDAALGGYRRHTSNISMSSGRKTVKNLGDHIYYQYWAERNAAKFAAERAIPYQGDGRLKGPYLLLWYMLVQDGAYSRFELPVAARLDTGLRCAWAFLTFPNIAIWNRAKNASLALVLSVTPRPLRLPLERRMVDYGKA